MEVGFYLIAYDIVDNKRRTKIAKALEALGERVQDSVFELYLKDVELTRLKKRIGKIVREQEDSLRIYWLCASCQKKVIILGKGELTEAPKVHIV